LDQQLTQAEGPRTGVKNRSVSMLAINTTTRAPQPRRRCHLHDGGEIQRQAEDRLKVRGQRTLRPAFAGIGPRRCRMARPCHASISRYLRRPAVRPHGEVGICNAARREVFERIGVGPQISASSPTDGRAPSVAAIGSAAAHRRALAKPSARFVPYFLTQNSTTGGPTSGPPLHSTSRSPTEVGNVLGWQNAEIAISSLPQAQPPDWQSRRWTVRTPAAPGDPAGPATPVSPFSPLGP
jgi:hypothetical protein